jgi:hypothetical protein
MTPNRQAFDHPAVWYASDFPSKDEFAIDLDRRHAGAFESALGALRTSGLELSQMRPVHFPLDAIAQDVVAWRREMRDGRGLLLLRGFPLDGFEPDDIGLMYFGLGLHFGRPVSQSNMGDLIGHVVNIGGKDSRERAYRNSLELNLHTDLCDYVAMLCLQPAWQGGISGYGSGLTVHNEMLAERPELLEPLYTGYHLHRFGQQLPGESLLTPERVPVFSIVDGKPSLIAMRHYSDLAEEEGLTKLSPIEREALDYFDEVAARDDLRLELTIERGELVFCNNCLVMHNRSGFEDHPDDALKRRHLMRLWLRDHERPIVDSVRLHKGEAGIAKQIGRGTYYSGSGKPVAGR